MNRVSRVSMNRISQSILQMQSQLSSICQNSHQFNQLKEIVPLIGNIKKADNNSKQIGSITKYHNQEIIKLKNLIASFPKNFENNNQVIDRAITQTNHQYQLLMHNIYQMQAQLETFFQHNIEQFKEESKFFEDQIISLISESKISVIKLIEQQEKFIFDEKDKKFSDLFVSNLLNQKLSSNFKQKTRIELQFYNQKLGLLNCLNAYRLDKMRYKQVIRWYEEFKSANKQIGREDDWLKQAELMVEIKELKKYIEENALTITEDYQSLITIEKNKDGMNYIEQDLYLQQIQHHLLSLLSDLRLTIQSVLITLRNKLQQIMVFQFQKSRNKKLFEEKQIVIQYCNHYSNKFLLMLNHLNLINPM